MPFDPEERAELKRKFVEFAETRDPSVRDQLIEAHLGLAEYLARRFGNRGEPLDDLVQVASLALVKAVDRFDAERGDAFSSYAVPTILGELKRHFRDAGWALHVPRGLQERVLDVNNVIEALSRELGHSPTPKQVAERMRLPVEDVLEAMDAARAYNTTSLETPRRGSEDDETSTIAETLGEDDDRFDVVEDSATIERGLKALPERERSILFLRFAEGLTQAEIAERIGISQMHVSRLIRRSIDRVRLVANAA